MNSKKVNRQYQKFAKIANRAPVSDDEYAHLAAYDALTAVFGLERHPAPPKRKRRHRATPPQIRAVHVRSVGVILHDLDRK